MSWRRELYYTLFDKLGVCTSPGSSAYPVRFLAAVQRARGALLNCMHDKKHLRHSRLSLLAQPLPCLQCRCRRERRAVVLGIAGVWEPPYLGTDLEELPAGWLGGGGEPAPAGSWVHAGSLGAAERLLAHLEAGGMLRQLLQPAQAGSAKGDEPPTQQQQALPDCSGWQLVLAGHGLGAGAAALLALKVQAWHPGAEPTAHFLDTVEQRAGPSRVQPCSSVHLHTVFQGKGIEHAWPASATQARSLPGFLMRGRQLAAPWPRPAALTVWAFAPPAQLCTPALAAELARRCPMTSVVVGDDFVPRATPEALSALVEQALVGLARLRSVPWPQALSPLHRAETQRGETPARCPENNNGNSMGELHRRAAFGRKSPGLPFAPPGVLSLQGPRLRLPPTQASAQQLLTLP